MLFVESFANRGRCLAREFLHQARIDVEFGDLALGVALQTLMKDHVPAIAEPQHLQGALVQQAAADLM